MGKHAGIGYGYTPIPQTAITHIANLEAKLERDTRKLLAQLDEKDARIKELESLTQVPEGWVLLQSEGDEYPPEAFLYRGGLYRYALEQEPEDDGYPVKLVEYNQQLPSGNIYPRGTRIFIV
jgi:hypothetical protein